MKLQTGMGTAVLSLKEYLSILFMQGLFYSFKTVLTVLALTSLSLLLSLPFLYYFF